MPYYDTLQEDIYRAKAIIKTGSIYGKDVYAAVKLLESFVDVIEKANAFVASGENCKRRYEHTVYPLVCSQCVVDIIGTIGTTQTEDG